MSSYDLIAGFDSSIVIYLFTMLTDIISTASRASSICDRTIFNIVLYEWCGTKVYCVVVLPMGLGCGRKIMVPSAF